MEESDEPMEEDLKAFERRHLELSIDQEVLMRAYRVIILAMFRGQLLKRHQIRFH